MGNIIQKIKSYKFSKKNKYVELNEYQEPYNALLLPRDLHHDKVEQTKEQAVFYFGSPKYHGSFVQYSPPTQIMMVDSPIDSD